MPIVTETGFHTDDWRRPDAEAAGDAPALLPLERFLSDANDRRAAGVDLANTDDPAALAPHFGRLALISVDFPSFADGRGFSIAKRLRDMGYQGRLRARGHVIVDQFAFARACGFDEIEIDDALAARQPEAMWIANAARPSWYQRPLRQRAAAMLAAAE